MTGASSVANRTQASATPAAPGWYVVCVPAIPVPGAGLANPGPTVAPGPYSSNWVRVEVPVGSSCVAGGAPATRFSSGLNRSTEIGDAAGHPHGTWNWT